MRREIEWPDEKRRPLSFGESTRRAGTRTARSPPRLQKAIRRGNEREALFWASELDLAGYGNYVWKRLRIIASEDVGLADTDAVIAVRVLYENWQEAKKAEGRRRRRRRCSSRTPSACSPAPRSPGSSSTPSWRSGWATGRRWRWRSRTTRSICTPLAAGRWAGASSTSSRRPACSRTRSCPTRTSQEGAVRLGQTIGRNAARGLRAVHRVRVRRADESVRTSPSQGGRDGERANAPLRYPTHGRKLTIGFGMVNVAVSMKSLVHKRAARRRQGHVPRARPNASRA